MVGDSGPSPQEAALQALILDADLERLEDMLAEFNLFRVLDIARDELSHSAFLAWLLNPRQTHGLGDYFLRHFLKEAAGIAGMRGIGELSPIDVDGWTLNDVQVITERQVGGSSGRVDILLVSENDEFVCVIENKIGTGEHSNQLADYLGAVEEEYGDLTPFPIFLTPMGTAPAAELDAERYTPLDYGKIADLIQGTLKARGAILNANVVGFLEQYQRTLGRYVVRTPDNIDELALRLYQNHRAAIDQINRVKNARGMLEWEDIDGWVAEHVPSFRPTASNSTFHRFAATDLDGIGQLNHTNAFGTDTPMALFEFIHDVRRRHLRLDIVVGPGPAEARQKLFRLTQNSRPLFHATKRNARYMHIFRKHILTPRTYHPFDRDLIEDSAVGALKDFYNKDYPRLINAICQEFAQDTESPQ